MVVDVKYEICKVYDVEYLEVGVVFCGLFLIDEEGMVCY